MVNQAPDGGGGSGAFAVDVETVRAVIPPLLDSLEVAREVWKHHEKMTEGLGADGTTGVERTAKEFLRRWGHAMGLVVKDGEAITQALAVTVQQYDLAEAVATGLMLRNDLPDGTAQYIPNPNPPISVMNPEQLAAAEAQGKVVRAPTVNADGHPVYVPNPNPPEGVTAAPAKPQGAGA
ncbi:hypothetical protein GT354_36905 [Streptomyces sp. SID3343]|nr:hypothetical protein [Streptomyces sp. SID3343]